MIKKCLLSILLYYKSTQQSEVNTSFDHYKNFLDISQFKGGTPEVLHLNKNL